MDPIIPTQDSLMDIDDWYNFTLSTGDVAEPFGCSPNPLASYCQPNTADFSQSRQYFDNQASQYPWDTVDTSLFCQSIPTEEMTAASTAFPDYVPGPMQSYSPDNFLEAYAGEDGAELSDYSRDYQLPGLEPSVLDSSASSEVEDYATMPTLSQSTRTSTSRRGRGRTTNKPRKATKKAVALDQPHPYRISKTGRTSSSDSEDLERTLAKQTHSEIERKYRNNLNAKMWQLHRTLEGTSRMSSSGEDSDSPPQREQQQQQQSQQQPRKSDILSNALQYINESELEMRHMSDEILRLKNRLAVLQRKVRCDGDCDALEQIVQMKMAS